MKLEHGKIQPQATELEKAVLGSVLIDKNAFIEISDILTSEMFYKDSNKLIFEACYDLFNENNPIDILTVTQKLKKKGNLELVGGAYAVSEISNSINFSQNIETHARIIYEKYIQRKVIEYSSELLKNGYDDTIDVFNLTEDFINKAYDVNDVNSTDKPKKNIEILRELSKKIEAAKTQKGITGLPTGFIKLDLATGGYQNSDLIIKAGRPAMGKTAQAICEAMYMAYEVKKKVLFFSLEMASIQLMQRIVSIETGISINDLKAGNVDWVNYNKKIERLTSENLIIYDKIMSLNGIRKECRKASIKGGCDVIFIDYLQLIEHRERGQNREQEISYISRQLKLLAKSLNVPVICLSQLSRAVETRGGVKKPMLSDLRDSGSIEQDADIVQFIYRPEYYGITEDEKGESQLGLAYLLIAKHRNGDTKDIPLRFIAHQTKFDNIKEQGFVNSKEKQPEMQPNKEFDKLEQEEIEELYLDKDNFPF